MMRPPSRSRATSEIHPVRVVSLLLAALFFFLAAMGVLACASGSGEGLLFWFHLDRELNLVTLYSAALLVTCGLYAFHLIGQGRFSRLGAGPVACLFVFMGLDEMFKVHETAERLVGIDWQILYLPLILVGGCSWAWVAWKSRSLTRWLWVFGAAAWLASQLFEAAQWGWWIGEDVAAAGYVPMMMAEELLEIAGTSLFLLSLARMLDSPLDPFHRLSRKWTRRAVPTRSHGVPISRNVAAHRSGRRRRPFSSEMPVR